MSGISSGIGLISGIDTASLIDQLIAIERVPIDTLELRVELLDIQRAAFLQLSAQLLGMQNSALAFSKPSFFRQFSAVSTDDSILTATAGATAVSGSITFRVRSLVSTHSVISRGFSDKDSTPIGTGTLTIEVGHGKVNASTELDALNGGGGIRRGTITITDRSGASADIDLRTAITIADVLDAINSDSTIKVHASVTSIEVNGATGDRLVIEDLSGGEGALTVADQDGGGTAADLGIAASVSADRIDGQDIIRLSTATSLALLNDGNGVGKLFSGTDLTFSTSEGDFDVSLSSLLVGREDTDLRVLNSGNGVRLGVMSITDRSGKSAEIDLTGATTVRDILDAINAADVSVTATVFGIGDASFFLISDESGVTGEGAKDLVIEDISGFTAADLGIAGSFDSESVQGKSIYRIATIGDLLNVINFASGNNSLIEASISSDGNGITLQALAPGSTVTVTGGTDGSTSAADLGLLDATFSEGSAFVSRHLIAGLDTVLLHSLNGGSGIGLGSVLLTDRSGSTTTIDFAGAQTLKEVIDLINADSSTGFVASVNQAGNGIALTDESGGAGSLAIEDVTGTLAANLGIAVTDDVGSPFVGNVVNGGNAQLQWVSPQTLLADLNAGQGVRSGEIKITDSEGAVYVVSLDAGFTTVGDVLQRINSVTPDTIVARINDTGDGIVVVDSSGGELSLAIEDIEGGSTAKDLRLAGEAGPSEDFIDGSYEYRIEIHGDDTLQDLVDKINAVGGPFSASTLNQGGTVNPISLSLTSGVSGQAGELTIDSTGIDFGFDTLTKASDAVITIGDDSVAAPLLVRSSTNTPDDVLEGVTLNLLSVSDESVTVSITQDLEGIVGAIESFVTSYNSVLDTIDVATSFDPDTLARGILLGDSTISLIRSRLASVMVREFEGVDPSVSRLFSVGLKLASGSRLEFDEEKFREVYAESPQLVENLFTLEETGFGEFLETALDDLTRDFDGVISRKDDLLESQQALLNGRIDSLNILLDAKRARLEAEFVTLETTLASLLAQQGALASLVQFVT